ncbi:MAG: hypothetical protein J6A59_11600 [Lachnospiraceae bacterium]|nr:hypothetical protein [Lachnospiraceae bacterium]
MKKFGINIYNFFAKATNMLLTLGILIIVAICLLFGSMFSRVTPGFKEVDAIVTYYNENTGDTYIEYAYNNDTMSGKFKSNLTIPTGHIVTLEIDKDEPTKFNIIDTNLVTDAGNNGLASFGVVLFVALILYKLIYGPFIKQKNYVEHLNNNNEQDK